MAAFFGNNVKMKVCVLSTLDDTILHHIQLIVANFQSINWYFYECLILPSIDP